MKTDDLIISYSKDLKVGELIESLPKGSSMKILFDDFDEPQRGKYGEYLKVEYPDFLIGIHMLKKEINVSRLISKQEIDDNIEFFTTCAEDYDTLSSELINSLILKLKMEINLDFPFYDFVSLENGVVNDWDYYRHGFHCCFVHQKTKQYIEASIVCGDQFGELDPYFFSLYILSTKEYHPLPTPIYHDYDDGLRILNRMVELGVLKLIESNWRGRYTYVLAQKDTSHIRPYVFFPKTKEKKNSFWHYLKNIFKK